MPDLVRPSRDGDQFHYLWATRRCLSLVAPQGDLVAIAIEGSSPQERLPESALPPGEQVIDIVEYYGDEDPRRARLVRYMQLKHSSRHAADHWTASGLKKTLTGFCARYRHLLQRFNADEVANRFEFWFVTNRPVSPAVLDAVSRAARDTALTDPIEREKLEHCTGLYGPELSSFCGLLRFDHGQDGYWDQRNILFQDVSGYLPDCDVDAPTQLKELVTRKALSESANNPVITKMNVLRALKTDDGRLFPARCLIETIDNAVPRKQEAGLVRAIVEADENPVIIHAVSGVGKSVFATRISGILSPGSVSILYDCFGNGQYRSATGYRHRHEEALVQIANELAAKRLCHLLIPTVHADAAAYLRVFVYRLRQAITLIRHANPHAVLCIIIDAADNAQMAAEEIGQARSFVRDLLREGLPGGVRLVVLCRSHRQNILDPPPRALRLELKPFTKTETAAHLRQTFPDASEHDVAEFHRLSSQNPRVEALALARKLSLGETLRHLGPNPTTPESSIRSLLRDSIATVRDSVGAIEQEAIDKVCAALAVLRPLVPISILARISGVSENSIRSLVLDLGRPLHLSEDAVQFLDEPVETWFRETFKPSQEELNAFVHRLTPLAAESAYVASTLPQLMLEAGQLSELVELALTSTGLPETGELEKHEVELHRLQFALKASLRQKRYLDATKLALKAGGVTAGDDLNRTIIQANTDLSTRFMEPDRIQELVSRRTFGSNWMGSHHAYEAGLLSGREALAGDARSRLRMAYEWLNDWSQLMPDERKKERISDADIAELAMAELNVHGAAAAAATIGMWKPREVSFRVGRIVASRLIDHGRVADLNDLAVVAADDVWLVVAIILELRTIQQMPPSSVVQRAFEFVAQSGAKFMEEKALDTERVRVAAVTALVEAAMEVSVCSHTDAAALLTRHLPETPPRGLAYRNSPLHSPLLRAYFLRAALAGQPLHINDVAHPELRSELENGSQLHSSQEAREFTEQVGALLPWYELWAMALLGKISKDGLTDRIVRARATVASITQYSEHSHRANEVALIWFAALKHLDVTDAESIEALVSWIKSLRRPLYTRTLTALARSAAWQDETKAISFEFAKQAFTLTRAERMDAESKSENYVDVARSVLAISEPEAQGYFDEALAVAGRVGEENLWRWDAILHLAERASRRECPIPETAYRFARCAELTWDYVVRDKHFDWESTVAALSSLCPSSCFAILSRWRDRGFGRTGRTLPIAVHAMVERGCVDPRDALALVGFEADWDYATLLGSVLEACTSRVEKEAAVLFLLRYVEVVYQSSLVWLRLKEVTAEHGLSVPGLDDRLAFVLSEERTTKERSEKHRKRSPAAKPLKRQWAAVFRQHDLTTVDGISRSYAAFKTTPAPWGHDEFFAELLSRVPVGGEAAFIASVGCTPEFGLYDLRELLERIPDTWKGRPSVKHALAEALKGYCRRYCMHIDRNRHYEVLPFDLACQLTGLGEADIVEVVLDAIGESPDLADAERVFSMVGLLKSRIDHEDALEALKFGLRLFDSALEDKDGDGPWSTSLSPPATIEESIAGYLYVGLAAPAAAIRWEAAHVVLGLCTLGSQEVLRRLMSLDEANSGEPFINARLPFYRLHARQWLLIAMARAATEFPNALAPFADRFVDLALHDQPHVMIRMFSSRAAAALVEHRVLPDDGLMELLSRVNVSSLPVVESESYGRINHETEDAAADDDEDRYYFGLDIGPYWYEPLGRIFGLLQGDVEREALDVIRNEFANRPRRAWHDDERARRKIYDYRETYASHGSYPDTDDIQYYLSYHAMMIVAGQFLATRPTHRDTAGDEYDEFAGWLLRHGMSRTDGRWLADRRDPAPLERPVWCELEKGDPEYDVVTTCDFHQALVQGDHMSVWGDWSTADSARVQSVHVRSALVSPARSMSLLRALSTAKDARAYLIPSSDADKQIDRGGFVLKGWIEDRLCDDRLDGKDKWSGGVRYPPPVPAAEIVGLMALETDSDRRVWYDEAKTPLLCSQIWGRLKSGSEDHDPERGERLLASLDFVKNMLSKIELDLIVEVQIERRGRRWSYEARKDDDERIPKKTRLYVIKSDGHFITL